MTSSCTSALACSSSSADAARTSACSSRRLGDRPEAPVAERRAEPLATADRLARGVDQPGRVVAEQLEPLALLVDERVQGPLHLGPEAVDVPHETRA